MPTPVSELRASGKVRRRTVDHTICLDSDLSDRYRVLREELLQLTADYDSGTRDTGGRARLGSRPKVTMADLEAKGADLDEVADQMAEFEIVVTIQQAEPADWNDWAAEHPPREQAPDEAGRRTLIIRDGQHGNGRCNFDALIDALPNWITALNGTPATAEEWAWVASQAAPGDLDDLADEVLRLHGGRVSLPKSLKSSLATLLDVIDSPPPKPGE